MKQQWLPVRHGDLKELSTEAAKAKFPAEAVDEGISTIIELLKVTIQTRPNHSIPLKGILCLAPASILDALHYCLSRRIILLLLPAITERLADRTSWACLASIQPPVCWAGSSQADSSLLQANEGEWKRRTALKTAVLGVLKDSKLTDACFRSIANVTVGDSAIYK